MHVRSLLSIALLMLAACSTTPTQEPAKQPAKGDASAEPQRGLASFTAEPIELDGRLDEAVWERADVHAFALPGNRGESPAEGGSVRFAYDETHFYAAFDFTDRDVVQESTQNEEQHFRTGDVAELFLKPADANHYWEFYVTPNGLKTAFFFPSRGRLGLPSAMAYESQQRVAASIDGTLNDPSDTDAGWTGEMAIPLEELADKGVALSSDHDWLVLAARYNYGRHLTTMGAQLSCFPQLRRAAWHLHEQYAPLVLSPQP
ncbi:MAG: carbohydrate-binding family 9-like protein [Phycisphaeraceae bacterium]